MPQERAGTAWLSQLPVAAFALDLQGRVIAWNDALAALTGIPADQALGRTDVGAIFATPELPQPALTVLQSLQSASPTRHLRQEFLATRSSIACDASLLRDDQGNVIAVLQVLHQEREANRLRRLFEASPDPAWIIENNRFVDCNDAAVAMLGYSSREALLDTHPSKLSPPRQPDGEDSFTKAEEMMRHARERGIHRFEWVHTRADGTEFDAEVTLARIDFEHRSVMYCAWKDISDRKRAEAMMKLYASAFHHSGEAVVITDAQNKIVAVNRALLALTGFEEGELIGKDPRIFSAGCTPRETVRQLWAALQAGKTWQGELVDRRKDGTTYSKWAVIAANTTADGKTLNYIASFTDMTTRKEAEARINWLAHHDALTGLLNRHGLTERLEQKLAEAHRSGTTLALALIDLDRFKEVNDTFGHGIGDQLLAEVARRIVRSLRDTDIVARLGGDEFVVALGDLSTPDDALRFLDDVEERIRAPYVLEGHRLNTSASVGIAFFPTNADDVEGLLREADAAMYQAKALSRADDATLERARTAVSRLTLERELWRALEREEFELHYQPQVWARTGALFGAEALVRWRHPMLGLLDAADFVAIAEECGAITRLEEWVLHRACEQLQRWQRDGLAPASLAVNLSPQLLKSEGLVRVVSEALSRHGLAPSALTLEISEQSAGDRRGPTQRVIHELAALGVRLVIDGFGTAATSLLHLSSLPIGGLKLDRRIVQDVCTRPDGIAAAIAFAHRLGLQVVAEGVESERQSRALLSLECDLIQGVHIGQAEPASGWAELVRRWSPPRLRVAE